MRLAVIASLVIATAPALATPSDDFEDARKKFVTGAYQETIALVTPLLYPKPPKLESERETAEAHLLLAVAFYETGQIPAAEREWQEALKINPGLSVGPPAFNSKQAEFFSERKAAYARELKRQQEYEALQRKLKNLVIVERRNLLINFVPFGAGQFQNGQTGKGLAFLISQAVFVGASAGSFFVQGFRYGFAQGSVPADEITTAETLQAIQIGTGVVALGLIGWGIVDALVYYKPTTSRAATTKEDLDDIDLDSGVKPTSSLQFTPTIGPNYAGAGLSVEF